MDKDFAVQKTELRVESGGYLEYLVDPLIFFPQNQLISSTTARIAPDSTLIFCESFISYNPDRENRLASMFANELIVEQLDGQVLAVDRFYFAPSEVQKILA